MDTLVLKFGSSVLTDVADLDIAVQEIYRCLRAGQRVVAIVSAFGATTDQLFAQAQAFGPSPPAEMVASLLVSGERQSAALLALALHRSGTACVLLDPLLLELQVRGQRDEALPITMDTSLIEQALAEQKVVVIPGFFGSDDQGRPALLGRGGSDLSALFVAWKLGSGCRLLKDVDGIYDRDPAEGPEALRYARLHWDEALRVGGPVVQPKAVVWARDRGVCFEVGAPGRSHSTWVGGGSATLVKRFEPVPLRVVLFGMGTVGLGVFQTLLRDPGFDLVGVGVRQPERWQHLDVPVTSDLMSLVEGPCDVVIELIGGVDDATALIHRALSRGCSVVTANKAVLAVQGPALRALANQTGATLLGSASVAGALPILERLRGLRGVRRIEGVINGTCNQVLDALHDGLSFDEAVLQAQSLGFAEADPTDDLDGSDSANKLVVLCEQVWGEAPRVVKQGIQQIGQSMVRDAVTQGARIRLVARCQWTAVGLTAEVIPELVPERHPFGELRGAENCIVVHHEAGRLVLRGLGAGRWPTTTSVVADLHALRRGVQ